MAKKYSTTHQWVEWSSDGNVLVGISVFAQQALGDVVYVELPVPGREVTQDEEVAQVESVKSASEIYSPISGHVLEVNESLRERPELINADAEGDAWLFRVVPDNPEEMDALMDEEDYAEFVADAEKAG